jgi:hypothetical protein
MYYAEYRKKRVYEMSPAFDTIDEVEEWLAAAGVNKYTLIIEAEENKKIEHFRNGKPVNAL